MDLWDLCTELDDSSEGLTHEHMQVIAYEIASRLVELHEKRYIHRDIKPENILLSKSGQLLLTDVATTGLDSEKFDGKIGTRGFSAPDADKASEKGDHSSLDMWSLGAILVWMTGGVSFILFAGYDADRAKES
jgi:serine/threonine protein kinase